MEKPMEEMQDEKMSHIGLIETLVIIDVQETMIENLHL
jgi:hypothetical protein